MKPFNTMYSLIKLYRWRWLLLSLGYTVLYYVMILVFTVIRFQQLPNYVNFENVLHVYHLILANTPSISDAISILSNEAFFETGFKDPNYYGVATWSYMLIPPKMLMMLLMAMLLSSFIILKSHTKRTTCMQRSPAGPTSKLTTTAGIGTILISLTNITLSWVVCCATPNWSVALAMLGLSSSMSLWLDPYGTYMTVIGLLLLVVATFYQARYLAEIKPSLTHPAI